MQIKIEKPPIYDAILQHGMRPHHGVVYTYGDTLYNPSNAEIAQHIIEHEEVHSKQQGEDPDTWWGRYLVDQYFRINQEAEAYGHQYKFICGYQKDRNKRVRILHDLSNHLSGPIYGDVIGYNAAMRMIKEEAGV